MRTRAYEREREGTRILRGTIGIKEESDDGRVSVGVVDEVSGF